MSSPDCSSVAFGGLPVAQTTCEVASDDLGGSFEYLPATDVSLPSSQFDSASGAQTPLRGATSSSIPTAGDGYPRLKIQDPQKPSHAIDGFEYQSRAELRHTQSLPQFQTIGEPPQSSLQKLLSYFADVRAGEGWSALLLTINVFLLLFAYYLLKTVREALILTEGGAYVKAYSSAGQAALLMALVPLYGFVGTKVRRINLIVGLLLFFIVNLGIFYLAGISGAAEGVVSTSGWESSTCLWSARCGPSPMIFTLRIRASVCSP